MKSTGQDHSPAPGKEPEAFICRRCGTCCTWHQAFVTPEDTERITKFLKISPAEWDEQYDDPRWQFSEWRLIRHINGACAFLKFDEGLSTCTIHEVKPACCAKWPAGLDKKECREGLAKKRG
jgi:Fe-S-cluster containining protein